MSTSRTGGRRGPSPDKSAIAKGSGVVDTIAPRLRRSPFLTDDGVMAGEDGGVVVADLGYNAMTEAEEVELGAEGHVARKGTTAAQVARVVLRSELSGPNGKGKHPAIDDIDPTILPAYDEALGSLHRVDIPFSPTLADELALNVNDEVVLRHVYEDGWGRGVNLTAGGLEGAFPVL
ncbi:hypothetical protein HK101_010141, partial [Irineochytrium annulatum]